MIAAPPRWPGRWRWGRVGRATDGLAADFALYLLSAGFAVLTASTSTLPPHRAWGAVAATGYATGAAAILAQLAVHRRRPASPLAGPPGRATLTVLVWIMTVLVPIVVQSAQRISGRADRAQDEVLVIERAGLRLLERGTPYLSREAIARLPADDRLLAYLPYQPVMAMFGLPRAVAGAVWWTDARIWFAVGTAVALLLAVVVLRTATRTPGTTTVTGPAGTTATTETVTTRATTTASDRAAAAAALRAVQLCTVLPLSALALATGGDDLPVLGLCLLAIALCAARRPGLAGIAIGLAAALKLLAWPIAAVLLLHGFSRGRDTAARLAAGTVGLPLLVLVPVQLAEPAALLENVLRFPLSQGLVTSPAQSPLPGYLISQALPGGTPVAVGLLAAAAAAIAVRLLREPPRTAADIAATSGYGLLTAILLMPSTRFGYLLYPVALLGWSAAVRLAEQPAGAAGSAVPPVLADHPTAVPAAECGPVPTAPAAVRCADPVPSRDADPDLPQMSWRDASVRTQRRHHRPVW